VKLLLILVNIAGNFIGFSSPIHFIKKTLVRDHLQYKNCLEKIIVPKSNIPKTNPRNPANECAQTPKKENFGKYHY
jgi:hypothetical protein